MATKTKSTQTSAEKILRTTLYSIGDAVIATDKRGKITLMNPVAETLTGWKEKEARGKALSTIFRIVNEETRKKVESPVERVLREGIVVGLANHTLLIARNGKEIPIADAGAPIFDDERNVVGVVLVFRDQTAERTVQRAIHDAREFAESILATVREPLLILDEQLEVVAANRSFHGVFKVKPEETIGKKVYRLGNRQWDIPELRKLLEDILPSNSQIDDFEVTHEFEHIGRRVMVLNARRLFREANRTKLILLAIEDITEQKRAEEDLRKKQERHRNVIENIFRFVPEGLLVFTQKLNLLKRNKAFEDIIHTYSTKLGYTDDELAQRIISEIKERLGNEHSGEITIAKAQSSVALGEELVLQFHTARIFLAEEEEEEEEEARIVVSVRDITERKRAEEVLQESEEVFRRLFEESTDPILLLNQKCFFDCNPATLSILQLKSKDEIGNKTPWDLSPEFQPDGKLSSEKAVEMISTAKQNGFHRFEWVHTKKDGSNFFVEVMLTPISLHGEEIFHVIWRDITERKRAEEKLKNRLEFENLISNISSNFINLHSDILDSAIIEALGKTGRFASVDRSYLFLFSEDGSYMDNTHEWCAEGIEPQIDNLKELPVTLFPWWMAKLNNFETIHIPRVADLSDEANAEKEILESQDIKSVVVIPMISANTLLGFLGFDSVSQEKIWADEDIFLLKTLSEIFISALERIKFETTLQENEQRYRSIVENINQAYYEADRRAVFTYCNPGLLIISGYTAEELLGTVSYRLVAEADRRRVIGQYQQWLKEKQTDMAMEFRVQTKSGRIFWVEQVTHCEFDTNGNFVKAANVLRDIDERKLAEEELRRSRERYEHFFLEDLTGDYISTPEGRLLTCNPAFARIFSFASVEEALATNITTLFCSPEERQRLIARLQRERKLEYYEMQMRKRDGTSLHIVANIIGRFDEHDRLVEMQGYLFDDTKRHQVEEALRQSQKLESLGTLASGIAHDFNNILGIIMGYAALLERLPPDRSTIQKSVEAITKAGMRGAALVKQMLTFARKTDVNIERRILNYSINEVVKLLHETFPKIITVDVHLDKNLPPIEADATQIHQVLLNLCVNARDAMPNGGTLTITTTRQSGEQLRERHPKLTAQEYVVLRVADTGMGMNKETKRRIFEPFFTTKEHGKGTGLGLSLVFGIMESHNGVVTVESEPGKGTTFYCYFPIPQTTKEVEEEKEQTAEELPGGTETLLVVEDEEMLREMVKMLLETKGYTVLTAGDGEEALSLYQRKQNEISLVLSDYGLPKFSGEELYRRMKSLKPDVLFVLASGFIEPKTKSELFKAGVKQFMQKPYDANEVLRTIRTVIDARK